MHRAVATLRSNGKYSQSRPHRVGHLDREIPEDYEARTWKARLHTTPDGHVLIPPMSFKNCLSEAAKFMSRQIPGKGKATYTKHFEAGIMITDPIILPIHEEKVEGEWLFVPADGKRGGPKRVYRCFPVIPEWSGDLVIHILDDIITKPVLEEHLVAAGNFIGIGRFRPRNNGYYGRFNLIGLEWEAE
jgi:hypothetical protein